MPKSEVNHHLHAAIMAVVDNQLRSNDPPQTHLTFKRLIDAGISEKEAKRLIACVVSAEIYDVLKQQKPIDLDRFVKALSKLPAMPWDDGDG